jgi:ABC-type uncharacterized transport system substrate-binding protein
LGRATSTPSWRSALLLLAAHKATETIPIVAFTAVDPVGSGLANSLANPGRNVTGIAVFSEETTVKRVELMREIAPRAVRLATVTTKVSKGAQSVLDRFWMLAENSALQWKTSSLMTRLISHRY